METVEKRSWYWKLCCFFVIFRNQSPGYLVNIAPTSVRPYNTRNANNIPQFNVKYNFSQNSFFSSVVIERNKLDQYMGNSENLFIFKKKLFKFIRPSGNSAFRCHNPIDSLNPICSCGQNIERSTPFFLPYYHYRNESLTFLNIIRNIERNIFKQKRFESYGNTSLWWQLIKRYKQHSYHECHHGIPIPF